MFSLIMKGNIRPHCSVLSLFLFKIKDAEKYTGLISLVVIVNGFIKVSLKAWLMRYIWTTDLLLPK